MKCIYECIILKTEVLVIEYPQRDKSLSVVHEGF